MKKLLLILLVMLFSVSLSQADTLDSTFAFINIQADNDEKVLGNYGLGIPLSDKLMMFSYVTAGEYNQASIDIGYFIKKSKLSFIIIAGPNIDWTEKVNDPVVYLVGASGAVITYSLKDYGLQLYYKYNFSFEDNNAYQDGYKFGAGFFISL